MVEELNEVFEIVLPQAGLVVTASGIILSLAKDMFKRQYENIGHHKEEVPELVLVYKSFDAVLLRNTLAFFARAILGFYLAVALLLVCIQIEIIEKINLDVFQVSVQIGHFIIFVFLLVFLVKSIKARITHALGFPAAPLFGPAPPGGKQGNKNE